MDRIPKWVLVVGALKIFGFSLPSLSDLKSFSQLALSGDENETFYEELLNRCPFLCLDSVLLPSKILEFPRVSPLPLRLWVTFRHYIGCLRILYKLIFSMD